MKKIGHDDVNLDFIFQVKCDHFSICPERWGHLGCLERGISRKGES